jgi:hypothetical protein
MGAIARPRKAAKTVLEGLGAAPVAQQSAAWWVALFGAMVGGAGGARMAHAAGDAMFGETPDPTEMDVAGAAGALGPVAARVTQLGFCLLSQLPSKSAPSPSRCAPCRRRRAPPR